MRRRASRRATDWLGRVKGAPAVHKESPVAMTSTRRPSGRETAATLCHGQKCSWSPEPRTSRHTRAASRSSGHLGSPMHRAGRTLHGGRETGQEGDDTDRCRRTGAKGGGRKACKGGELRAGRDSDTSSCASSSLT